MNGVDVSDVTRNFTSEEWNALKAGGALTYINRQRALLSGRGGGGRGGGRGRGNNGGRNVSAASTGSQQQQEQENTGQQQGGDRGGQNGRGFGRGAYGARGNQQQGESS